MHFSLTNKSALAANWSTVQVYLSADPVLGPDDALLLSIPPGSFQGLRGYDTYYNLGGTVQLPNPGTTQTYYPIAIGDPVSIVVIDYNAPDLYLNNVSSPASVTTGSALNLATSPAVTVSGYNSDPTATVSTSVAYFLSTNTTLGDSDDIPLGTAHFTYTDSFHQFQSTLTLTLPTPLPDPSPTPPPSPSPSSNISPPTQTITIFILTTTRPIHIISRPIS